MLDIALMLRGIIVAVGAGLLIGFFAFSWAGRRARRYVFIDGGAHVGETVEAFEKSVLATKHPWSIVSFEPNPTLVGQIPAQPNLTVLQEAIWTKDEERVLKFSEADTFGGSVVVPTGTPSNGMQAVEVKAIDFGRWLRRHYTKDDVVYVKFDIEGAEYPVLEQMLKDGTIGLVDRLYIEFHGPQQAWAAGARGAQIVTAQKRDRELIEAISGAGTAVSIHLPEEPQGAYFGFDPEKYGQSW